MEYRGCSQAGSGQIDQACEKILSELECDFVGLALQNTDGPDVRWHYAAGNSNEKYKRITVRYGKGIAGKVISTGRPMYLENFPENISGKVLEYPIMLAESLNYAYAFPIHFKGIPKGVLLIGNRNGQAINEDEQSTVRSAARRLEEKLSSLI
ncbi:GAF domain-containing protein [Bacillus sp. ISL-47]|uniref:GAF domain-containing protein n=1 Tax=Bacillus sp. ISL-47 TaxID=2819130 RepID=UPI001BE8A065|nr:GAF domain-containing protein [Bacillus sp. ISL-47]MBT2689294.1 GAF domain-containing protein [Bacillus sp. ISL-47]MBT2707185.1 GAF domain-containing protein [Pseudomonas sp. ISL-84]